MGKMTIHNLTAWSQSAGWRDIQVLNAGGMHEAIQLAEKVTGCRVSHGRSGEQSLFDPGTVIDAESGAIEQRHKRSARPEVALGPPDVVRAIAQALKGTPKAAPRRKVSRKPEAAPASPGL